MTGDSAPHTDVPATDVRFVDEVRPALPADDYRLAVTQKVKVTGGKQPGTEYVYEHEQRLRVTGPHFGLSPGDVVSVYPPHGSQADYAETLPHALLSRRDLPWEISLDGASPQTPWLAVLVLTPEDIHRPADDHDVVGTQPVPLGEYLRATALGDGVMRPAFSDGRVSTWLEQYPLLVCTVVDLDAAAFAAVAPRMDELQWLAHARQASTGGQEIGAVGKDEWCSVVIGNRLPSGSPTGVYVAHLVSLEGYAEYLRGDRAPLRDVKAVRLLSLASWSFNSLPGKKFADVMGELDIDLLRLPADREPDETGFESELVAAALYNGYTGIDYRTRVGEQTVGWYRGPLVPFPTPGRGYPEPYAAAEGALAYDRQTGMFDTSTSVSWQIGRLLALANRQFVLSLSSWVRANASRAHLVVERLARLAGHSVLETPDSADDLAAPDLFRRLSTRFLTRVLGPSLAPADPGVDPLLGAPMDPTGLPRGARP